MNIRKAINFVMFDNSSKQDNFPPTKSQDILSLFSMKICPGIHRNLLAKVVPLNTYNMFWENKKIFTSTKVP